MGQINVRYKPHYNVTLKMRKKVRVRRLSGYHWDNKMTVEAFGDTPMGVLLNAIYGCGHEKDVKAVTNVTQIHEFPAMIILDIKP